MHIVTDRVAAPFTAGKEIAIEADRHTLAKRRWQGTAADGTLLGFDVKAPLSDGTVVLETASAHYVLRQKAEPLLEIPLASDPAASARLGWSLGNLHFPIEITATAVRVSDDPAVRLFFQREQIAFTALSAVFRPLRAVAHSHEHAH